MDKLIFTLVLVVLGVCCGYLFQQLAVRDLIQVGSDLTPLKKRIQKIVFLGLNPVAIVGATWVARLEDINLIALPFLCITALAFGGVIAYGLSRLFRMNRKQTGAYVGCGTFTNIGALGALFCYMFLGEPGFALVPIYKLLEEFTYFAYVFPLAKSFSIDRTEKESLLHKLKVVFTDPLVDISIASIALGLVLNMSGLHRPEFFADLNAFLIPAIVFLLLFTIGLGMRFSSVGKDLAPALAITAMKFTVVPVVITGLGYLVGLHEIDNGLPLKVVYILSAGPVGFISVIPPTLYDLDADLANTCWLICNGLLIIQVPIILFVVNMMVF